MSVTWTLTAGGALQRAYLMLGQLQPPDYTLSDFQTSQGLTVMNGILKGLQVAGPNVFRQTITALTANANSTTVSIPNDVVGIEEARWAVSSTYDRPLGRFQWIDYQLIPNKTAAGPPSLFMFDYQRDSTQLYIWPVPTTAGTINCTTVRRANDVSATGDAIDLPSEWIEGFTYMVADGLMDDQGVAEQDPATAQRITSHAAFWKQKLEDFDRPTSVFLRPYGRPNSGRLRRF